MGKIQKNKNQSDIGLDVSNNRYKRQLNTYLDV